MSETVVMPNSCPKCGAALPSAATAGLCPRCLMAEAMEATQTEAEPATPHKALSPAELAPHFPQLEILGCLGRGGMGVVYKARQKSLNRLVALKLLAPERVADAKFAQRFTHEAQALAALSHPNIVTIYDFGQAGGFYFLLMEFVDGVNLRQAMKAGRFTPEQALAVVPPVCEALQYAHEHGIVHRDIKPENLLLDRDGRVKIADFGIAKMLGTDGARLWSETQPQHVGEPAPAAAGPADTAALQTEPTLASAAGTPRYMAPEQRDHRRTDHRADIYSLGVVLYELLTGEMPADKLQPPSRKVQIDVRLDEIVLRALETKPELRFQTAGEFRTQLETIATPSSRRREEPPAPPAPTPLLKTANAYVSTPDWLASARGRFWVYSGKGTLVLTRDQLAFTDEKTGATTSIPLAAIRDVSLGNYPWLAKPAPLHYLSVTWVESGLTRCRYFTPNRGWFMPVWETNPVVIEWHQALRAAVTAATGKPPAETPTPAHRPTVADFAWVGLMFGLPMLLIGTVFLLLQQKMTGGVTAPFWQSGSLLALVGILFVVPIITFFFLARRSSQPDGQPAKSSKPAVLLLLLVALNGAVVWGIVTAARLLKDFFANPSLAQRPGMDPAFTTKLANFVADHPGIVTFVAIFVCLVVDALIIRRFWRAKHSPAADSGVSAPPSSSAADVGQLQTPAGGWQAPRTVWGHLVGALFGITFTSPLAFKLANLSALGFLGFLGFVGFSEIDGLRWCLGFFGFSGFFGLIGVASIVEMAHRRKRGADTTSPSARSPFTFTGLLLLFVLVLLFGFLILRLVPRNAPSYTDVTRFEATPVGVSNHVVLVDVSVESARWSFVLRPELTGPRLPREVEEALAAEFRPASAVTVVRPAPLAANQLERILSGGQRHTLRLAFVLPTAELAEEAFRTIRPIGPLPAVPSRTHAGTLFVVRGRDGAEYHAALQVGLPKPASEAGQVAIGGRWQRGTTNLTFNFEVSSTQPGTVKLRREGNWATTSLQLEPKAKRYRAPVTLELSELGTNRVLLVSRLAGVTTREEHSGDFRELAAELSLGTNSFGANAASGGIIELCQFQGKSFTVQVEVLPPTVRPTATASIPAIERAEISPDKAVVHQAHYDGSGLLFTFGTGTNRWTPSGRYLDGLFNVTLEWPRFGKGAMWVIKPRHGIHMNYRLDGPPGPMLGKLVFHPGMARPDAEGFCVIGAFQPETGEPLPLAVQLAADQPSQPRPAVPSSITTPAPVKMVDSSVSIIGIGVIGLCVIGGLGGIVLLVVLVRKGGTAGKVVAVLVAVSLLLLMLGIAALLGYKRMATTSVQSAALRASAKLGQMILESNYPGHTAANPPGRVMQAQNGFRLHLPAMQLASFEFLIRDADDTWRSVPSLTAYVATGTNGGYHNTLYWTLRRDGTSSAVNPTNQLWFWSVSATVNGGQEVPHLADHGTNFTHTLAPGDQLDWWQLAVPPQTVLQPGEQRFIPLFRTHGSATARGTVPKEAAVRVRCEPLPAALNLTFRDQFVELGLAAHAALEKVLPAKSLPATAPRKIAYGVSPIRSSEVAEDNSPAAIAAAQQQGIASATEDIQAGVFRILAYGDLISTSPEDKDEETGFRIQWVAGSFLSDAFRAETDAYNFAMRDWFWKNRPDWSAAVTLLVLDSDGKPLPLTTVAFTGAEAPNSKAGARSPIASRVTDDLGFIHAFSAPTNSRWSVAIVRNGKEGPRSAPIATSVAVNARGGAPNYFLELRANGGATGDVLLTPLSSEANQVAPRAASDPVLANRLALAALLQKLHQLPATSDELGTLWLPVPGAAVPVTKRVEVAAQIERLRRLIWGGGDGAAASPSNAAPLIRREVKEKTSDGKDQP